MKILEKLKETINICMLFAISSIIAQSNLKIGDVAPQICITDKILNCPSDLNYKDKFIVLEFWATWCMPCLEVVPKMNQLEEKFANQKDLIFISITDEKPEKVARILKKIPFESIVVSDQTKTTRKNFIESSNGNYNIPTTILIDKNNIIRWIGNPFELNENVIKMFVKKEKIDHKMLSENNRPPAPIAALIKKCNFNSLDFAFEMIKNDTINFYFSIINSDKIINNKIHLNNLESRKNYMNLNKNLQTIYANLNNVKLERIQIPESYLTNNYSIFYKNNNLKNEKEALQQINYLVNNYFGLTETIVYQTKDCYVLQLIDKNKLEQVKDTESQSGANNTHFVCSAVSIDKMLKFISASHKIEIINETGLVGNFDFFLRNNNIKSTNADLENYGLKLVLLPREISFYKYN